MAIPLFLDTNIVLDLALNRSEFVKDAEALFHLKDQGKIDIYISALSLANVAYIADKHDLNPFDVVAKFLDLINVVELETFFFKQVIESGFVDFEDGLQYFSAAKVVGLEAIITRDKKHFKPSLIPVFTPAEYLRTKGREFTK